MRDGLVSSVDRRISAQAKERQLREWLVFPQDKATHRELGRGEDFLPFNPNYRDREKPRDFNPVYNISELHSRFPLTVTAFQDPETPDREKVVAKLMEITIEAVPAVVVGNALYPYERFTDTFHEAVYPSDVDRQISDLRQSGIGTVDLSGVKDPLVIRVAPMEDPALRGWKLRLSLKLVDGGKRIYVASLDKPNKQGEVGEYTEFVEVRPEDSKRQLDDLSRRGGLHVPADTISPLFLQGMLFSDN